MLAAALLAAASVDPAAAQPRTVNRIADDVVAVRLSLDPAAAYLYGLPLSSHDSFGDRSAAAIAAARSRYRELQRELAALDSAALAEPEEITFEVTKEFLDAELGLAACRRELWSVDHMFGWQRLLPIVAERQPVDTADERAQALKRWRSLGAWIDTEIANLRTGLAEGYSAPRSVVGKVIVQVEQMAAAEASASPLGSPASRAKDPGFAAQYHEILKVDAQPALRRYADFLRGKYQPGARAGLAVSELPNGRECYAASLRSHTTLRDTPEEIMKRGSSAVTRNLAEIAELTGTGSGQPDLAGLMQSVRENPANRLRSEDEVLTLAKQLVAKGREASRGLVRQLPRQPLEVKLYPQHLRGTGASSHYAPSGGPGQPASFMIQTDDWQMQRRSDIEILAFHEAFPGHHLQQGLVAEAPRHPISKLAGNSAYVEGWAMPRRSPRSSTSIQARFRKSSAARGRREAWLPTLDSISMAGRANKPTVTCSRRAGSLLAKPTS